MASLSRDGKSWRIQYYDRDGKRRTLRLPGKIDKRAAQAVKARVESILAAKLVGIPLPQDVAGWLGSLGSELYDRLAAVGLVPPRQFMTLGEFLADWLRERRQDKPSSLAVYRRRAKPLQAASGAASGWVAIYSTFYRR